MLSFFLGFVVSRATLSVETSVVLGAMSDPPGVLEMEDKEGDRDEAVLLIGLKGLLSDEVEVGLAVIWLNFAFCF